MPRQWSLNPPLLPSLDNAIMPRCSNQRIALVSRMDAITSADIASGYSSHIDKGDLLSSLREVLDNTHHHSVEAYGLAANLRIQQG